MEKPRPHLRLVVAALCVVAVLFACNAPLVHLSTAPAEKLALTLTFTHLLTPSAQVVVDAVLSSAPGNRVELTDKQHLTVNGRNEDAYPSGGLGRGAYRFIVPRSPVGGEYTAVYTDERGQQTSVIVPAPQRDLTITSPAAHVQLAIPQPGEQIAVRYTDPSLFPPTSSLPRPPSTQISAGAEGHCRVARSDGISASAPSCISIITSQLDVTDSAVISDKDGLPEYGFGNLAPGPGLLYVKMDAYGNLPPAGFSSVLFSSTDVASIPITWV